MTTLNNQEVKRKNWLEAELKGSVPRPTVSNREIIKKYGRYSGPAALRH